LKRLRIPLPNNTAVSYTVSAMIITATTITLVLVASIFAYQILERQRGVAEFDIAKESILAFNDALENVAWKPQAARSARFTIEYGFLELMPNFGSGSLEVNATLDGTTYRLYNDTTGAVRYNIKTQYVNLGNNYTSYLIGDEKVLVNESIGSYGVALIEQQAGWVTVTLFYRVRAIRTSVVNVTVNGAETRVNYVDIWVIRLNISRWYSYVHDFDLKARCLQVQTITPHEPIPVGNNSTALITAKVGDYTSSASVPLTQGKVVFNVIVAEVQVSV
jgi:hypothetical protein